MGSTPSTSRASWWQRRTARNKSLSQRISSSRNDPGQKWVSFLIAKKTLLVIKYPFQSRHQNIHQQPTAGAEPKKPRKNLVYQKCIRIRAEKQHQGHLNMRIDQEKISQCCNRK